MKKEKYFPWLKKYELGIEAVDEQHNILVNYIDDLYNAIVDENEAKASEIVLRLAEYAGFHFKAEEEFFDNLQYSEVKSHKKEHNDFIAEVSAFIEKVKEGRPITMQLIIFLKEWLLNHILKTDKQYAVLVNPDL